MKVNGENLFYSSVISSVAIVVGIAIGYLFQIIFENPINLVYVGLWVLFTIALYISYERHLKRKLEAEE